ncbi:3-hydroxyacyl-CoA dehydrogenase NAD-binding domain-containing protein [Steroidobacter cummioxidans]|uniref:3-hydroxyacyl-CoA dehydrogenase NAD-binding domain-containing protein n=1 Tax=Steroidobacter cummioxidans TaxID=1803913 RepID=UPI000E31D4AB|nr:3-hydroxyacyl-CoA dehydrogenase NAD-binding domain-containing protein [Steroidobacter cummioxidans]
MKTLRLDVDADGIALITLDAADKPMNVVSPQFIDDMIAAIERVAGDAAIKGAIITSGKPAFMAGADLKYILGIAGGGLTLKQAYAFSQKPSVQMHRRMETCGKPFVAAINGLALGGGYELALACHHRVIVDDPKAVVGLPEVTVGLLPGSGGTQRLARMVGVEKAAALLLDGRQVPPGEALQLGMVDQVVPAAQLLSAAREWLLKSPNAVRAWDVKGYRGSSGLLNPTIVKVMSERPAQLAASTRRNYPAPIAILDCLFQGTLLPFDKALQVESKHFARLLCDPVARNLIRTSFVNRGEATKLARRPQDIAKSKVTRVGVLGAGMMGSGIAYVSALAGIDVVLLDSTQEQAEKGKQYSVKLLAKAVERGKQTKEAADTILARINPTTEYAALAGCELVVEAVFEDVAIKAEVTKHAEAMLPPSAIFASNTSTLPITKLAEASSRPAQFIGLHFFSPVDRMPLVEVIMGKSTSQETLAKSLDFIAQLRMTPIVVNDSRGFYTSRVFQTFIHEGMRMLEEGIEPARIENAAIAAGFPVGPLALLDEVTIELPWKIVQEAEAALGANYVRPCAYDVMRRMLYEIKRPGRRSGGGFYEYPAAAPKHLWPGLSAAFPPARRQPEIDEVRDRLLYVQAIETARCLEEGVLTHPADADIGALLGWGFPAWTGGPLSFIETVGLEKFVENAERMAAKYGKRFAPSDWLRARAEQGENFYQAAVPRTAAA